MAAFDVAKLEVGNDGQSPRRRSVFIGHAGERVVALRVGLLGLGTVGSGTAAILLDPSQRHPLVRELVIARAGVRSLEKQRSISLPAELLTTDLDAIVSDPNVDIVVEVLGGLEPARSLILKAIAHGKHVVTANKAAIARYGDEIFAAARAAGVYVAIEAAVGGGIPTIQPLKHALSVNRIRRVLGIVNGTTNYILTRMATEGADFAEVLADAQRLGYAEADPTADVDGLDAADKIAILAAIAFSDRVKLDDIHCEGIRQIGATDIGYAERLGFAIKLLAIAQREAGNTNDDALQVRVHPTLVPREHPLASINGVNNAIFIEGDPIGEVMLFGPGAGAGPTASAVVADLVSLVALMKTQPQGTDLHGLMSYMRQADCRIVPITELVTRFYARIDCIDRPGVIGYLGTTFGKHDVSLESIVQTDRREGLAEIVVVTHDVREGNFRDALAELASGAIEQIAIPSVLRVL
ncbi:Homoserine dehydrogenase [Rubidibacter lacunae KORDI 51-2]|uniref:Homoserine dehydrogenase n=1 Tax=Rubidibacter lacunae KORDI 51-2 TaxID=582515 RepID=U5DLN2_9CHRO|nr:Homoserine dehydrogenase [Rubidibacter lacunae KORDI 51-2]